MSLPAFTYELIRDSLYYLCEEMMTELRSICISTVIREAQDCATAITDADGNLIAQSTGTPGHYNSVPTAVKGMLKRFPSDALSPGDVLLTNDPWICAGHLPDVVVATPIFFDHLLVAFAVTVAHHLDMGGKNPGSTTANTTEIFQDGLQLPPVKIVTAGSLQNDLMKIIEENVRLPDVIAHDLQSEITVNFHGSERLMKILKKYGLANVLQCFQTALKNSEDLTRSEIRALPDGSWSWADKLDDDGQDDRPVPVNVSVTIAGEEIYVNFDGTAPQVKGGINMTPSFRDSYTHLAIRCFLDPSIPHNQGCFRPIHISAPPRTIVSPERPAAVGGRSVLISRVADVIVACLSQAISAKAVAGYGGCNAQPVISGVHPDTGRNFIFLDTNWGGLGGRQGKDGVDCLSFPQNVANHPIEVLEAHYPVLVERFEIRPDSEGAGKFRGGFGSIKDYRLLADGRIQIPGDRAKYPPFGLRGGSAAALTEYLLIRDGVEMKLPTKREFVLQTNDVVSVRTPGGGGLFPPDQRDPDLIRRDVQLGFVTPERAKSVYGIDTSSKE